MSFEEFQNGGHDGHLGYWNKTILAILDLHVARCLTRLTGVGSIEHMA